MFTQFMERWLLFYGQYQTELWLFSILSLVGIVYAILINWKFKAKLDRITYLESAGASGRLVLIHTLMYILFILLSPPVISLFIFMPLIFLFSEFSFSAGILILTLSALAAYLLSRVYGINPVKAIEYLKNHEEVTADSLKEAQEAYWCSLGIIQRYVYKAMTFIFIGILGTIAVISQSLWIPFLITLLFPILFPLSIMAVFLLVCFVGGCLHLPFMIYYSIRNTIIERKRKSFTKDFKQAVMGGIYIVRRQWQDETSGQIIDITPNNDSAE